MSAARAIRKEHDMIKLIACDMDGTLLDTLADLAHATEAVLRDAGLGRPDGLPLHSLEEYRHFVGNGARRLIERAAGTADPALIGRLLTDFLRIYDRDCQARTKPYPGIPELLRDLKASDVRIAVATGKPTVFSEQILEHFGLRQYIDVVSGIPLDREPPDKCEEILHALYEMGISDRSGCVMVGDRSHDAIGAKMARIDFIGVLYG